MKSLDQIFCVESKVSAGIHQLLSEPLLELHIKGKRVSGVIENQIYLSWDASFVYPLRIKT